MNVSRRNLLKKGVSAALVGGTAGYALPSLVQAYDYLQPGQWDRFRELEATPEQARKAMEARKNKVLTRKHIGDLTPEELLKFKAAIGIMRARSDRNPMDPSGWTSQALQHALYCSSAVRNLQVHWSWFFLPWHRGYLRSVEQLCAAAIGDENFALPYWDWTRSPFIDPAYLGFDNPLHDQTRLYTGTDEIPADFMDIEAALQAPDFSQFGGYPYPKGSGELTEGVMEQSFHNNVHNWIGGNMGAFPTAAFDPIFTGHHGNIDRAWTAWASIKGHKMPTEKEWLDTFFTYPSWDGGLERVSVKDMIDSENVGYRFADLTYRQPDITPPALSGQAASFGVAVNDSVRKRIANKMKSGRRYGLLKFERMQVPLHPLCARVYLSEKGQTPHYVSTITILPVQTGGIGHLNKHVTMQMALPPALAGLIENGKDLHVHMNPVQLRGRDIPKAPIQLSGVSLITTDNA